MIYNIFIGIFFIIGGLFAAIIWFGILFSIIKDAVKAAILESENEKGNREAPHAPPKGGSGMQDR